MVKSSASPEPVGPPAACELHWHERLCNLLPIAVVVTDAAGKVVHTNAKAWELCLVRASPSENGAELVVEGFVRADGSPLPRSDHPAERLRREGLSVVEERIGIERSGQMIRWLRATATDVPNLGAATTYVDFTASRQIEDDLHHSLDQLDAFFNANLDLLAILTSDGRAIRLNPAWFACLGYEPGSVDYAHILDLVHPGDMEITLGALARLRTPDEVVTFTDRIRHQDGGYRMFEWRATARDDLVYASARDVTEQRQAEAALLRSEERYRTLFEQAAMGVAEVDPRSGRFIQVNQRFCEILGYTRAELEERTFASLSHTEGLEKDLVAAKRLATGEISEYRREKRYLHKDGRVVWVDLQVKAIGDPGKDTRRNVTVIQDITARREADELLRKALNDALDANQRLSFQSSRMPLAYIAWDRDFRVTEWNYAAERIFGWTASQAIGKQACDLIIPPDVRSTINPLWNALLDNDISGKRVVNENCTRDGRRITCEWFNAPLVNAQGTIIGALSMAHDITERLRLEENLRHSRHMESLASFAGGVALDTNNVLYTITRLASSISSNSPDEADLRRSLDAISQACTKGRSLVRGLLDFARYDVTNAKAVDLNGILEEQISLLGREIPASVHIERDFDRALGALVGDGNALAAAFMHLCLNALEAMPNGGILTLRTRMRGKNEVVVEVKDTGVGMSEEVRELAMDPFFTTKSEHQRSGLGLPAVYGVVKAHQGRVEIQSEAGKGTRVEIILPMSHASSHGLSETPGNPTQAKGLRILVVDDDELVQATVSAQLRRLGHAVTLADDGQAALDRVREGLDVDLVLLDINMPVLDGTQTLPRLRDLRPHLPVIIETGGTGDEARALAGDFPDVSILCRPFTTGELKAALAPWAGRVHP